MSAVRDQVTLFLPKAKVSGYSPHDRSLEDLLFGIAMVDETPEGATRTWVYSEGVADETGCFEPLPDGHAPAPPQPDAAVPLARIDTSRQARHYWAVQQYWQQRATGADRGRTWRSHSFSGR